MGLRDDDDDDFVFVKRETAGDDDLSPGDPARVGIRSAFDLQRGDRVIICSRVSGERQLRGNNLRRETLGLAARCAYRGLRVVGLVELVGPAWTPGLWAGAAERASDQGAVLVAWDVTRFARDARRPRDLPTDEALVRFRHDVGEVGAFTVVDPAADQREIDRQEYQRGVGPGLKESEVSLGLMGAGCSVSLVARIVGVDRRSVYRFRERSALGPPRRPAVSRAAGRSSSQVTSSPAP